MKFVQTIAFYLTFAAITEAAELKDPVAKNARGLANIVFVHIDIEKEPVGFTFQFINQRWKETDPHNKGFDFKISPKGSFQEARLTIKKKNIKVYELAGIIAAQLNADITISSKGIIFSPRK